MIVTDLYATDSTIQSDLQITANVTSLNLTDKEVDPMVSYYMGEVSAPLQTLLYRGTFKYTDGVYKLERNKSVKPNWGYAYTPAGSGYYPSNIAWNGSKWVNVGSAVKFINAMKYYKATMAMSTYALSCYLYDFSNETTLGTGEHIRYATTRYSGSFNASTNGFYSVFVDDGEWSVTINSTTYTLSKANWNSTGCFFDVGDNKRIYITQISNASGNNYNCVYYNGHQFYLDLTYSIETPDRLLNSRGCRIFRQLSHYYNGQVDIDKDYNRAYSGGAPVYGGGSDRIEVDQETVWSAKPFEVTYEVVNYCTTYSPTSHQNEYVINSNDDLVFNSGYSQVRVNNFVDLFTWIKYALGIAPKWATNTKADGTAMTYNNNSPEYLPNTAVPIFNKQDDPYGSALKKDTYRELEGALRPWQKYGYDITDDEYDPEGGGGGGGSDDDDPSDPTKEDGIDEGDPNAPDWYSSNYSMTKFVNLAAAGWNDLKANLQQAIVDTVNNPTDTTKLGYLLGTFKSDGTFECADDLSIFKFIASARWYPFDVSALYMGSQYVVNQTPEAALSFGYRGASVACSNKRVAWPIAALEIVTLQVPNKKGTTSINDCTFEDFEPYTKYTLMLPFVGELSVPAHNAVCATIGIKYIVDFSSGTCCAIAMATGGFNSGDGATCLGVLSGQCSTSVSVAGNDVVAQGDQIASATLNKASTELALARSKFDMGVTLAKSGINIAEGAMTASDKGYSGGIGAAQEALKAAPDIVHSAMDIAANNISDKMADITLTQAQRSVPFAMNWGSNVTGNLFMSTPSMRIERSLIIRPENYKHVYGYPTCKQFNLSGIKGYFQCANPDISGIGSTGTKPTETEQQMINEALRTGSFMGDGN